MRPALIPAAVATGLLLITLRGATTSVTMRCVYLRRCVVLEAVRRHSRGPPYPVTDKQTLLDRSAVRPNILFFLADDMG